jgi:hypothetical protein
VVADVETYLKRMAEIHATGGATSETSYYGALENLLNAVGKALKPKVVCNGQIRNQGAGHPDFGLYGQSQCAAGAPKESQGLIPERGVVEVKGLADDAWQTATTGQVSKYWQRYGLVLVTNYREFLLIGADAAGRPVRLEHFSLAKTDAVFWEACAAPKRTARKLGGPFLEYLKRALAMLAPLSRPADLAWLLASYARDALARVEQHAKLPALATVRAGLEEALDVKFEGATGEHFFRSTLVQTLFYGVFSAWVQWSKSQPLGADALFDWRSAGWSLHVPMVSNLFHQMATPDRLGRLGLIDVLDWTGAALNRVDRAAFFAAFDRGRAVQYFYEPFLAAFDPELRKQLGVWYTPPEIVRYMVARVDQVLQSELGIADGLADPNVYVLDPCCGTGSFVVEVLNLIAERLRQQGGDALLGQDLKQAAMARVFGFEIMPAPFVIAHWQVGQRLADAGAPLDAGSERAAIYLTNALTGWQPSTGPKKQLSLPELEEERDAAEHVKREVPILVVIGNPPYNAYAGTSPAPEEGLVEPYKKGLQKVWGIRKFNLDDLYVRFFRIAERRIAAMTGRGLISFISNYSWTERDSFVVMRQSLLSNFDRIWIENMHGNRAISEYAPDGRTSETVFAVAGFSPGIQQGITISLLARTGRGEPAVVRYRDDLDQAKAEDRRTALLASLQERDFDSRYAMAVPTAKNRFSFRPWSSAGDYMLWPKLVDIAARPPQNGLMEKRAGALVDMDRESLVDRMRTYFDPKLKWSEIKTLGHGLAKDAARFDAENTRRNILQKDEFNESNVVRYFLRPFDIRFAYYTSTRPLWNEPRPNLWIHFHQTNQFLISRPVGVASPEGMPISITKALGDNDALRGHAYYFSFELIVDAGTLGGTRRLANLSTCARAWLAALGWPDPDADAEAGAAPWLHALAICCAPLWLQEHQAAILAGWPRVPLPSSAAALATSAALGARLAALLDPDQPVAGVTSGALDTPFAAFGAISRAGGGQLAAAELALTAGWGHGGGGKPVMPSRGRITERAAYTAEEFDQIAAAAAALGESADRLLARLGPPIDVWLNDVACWRAVPAAVWDFRIGGYQVLKKWLSYRDQAVLGRPLTLAEAREATAIVRRLAAIVLMQPALNANYEAIRDAAYAWPARAKGQSASALPAADAAE